MALPRRLNDGISRTPTGAYRHQVKLLSRGTADNVGNVSSPTVFATVWAAFKAVRGMELLRSDQIVQKQMYQVKLRYMPGVEESMLVQFQDKNFQIDYMENPDGMNVELWLMCSETDESI